MKLVEYIFKGFIPYLFLLPGFIFADLDETAYVSSYSEILYDWEISTEILNDALPTDLYINHLNNALSCCHRVIDNCDKIIYDISMQPTDYIRKHKWLTDMALRCEDTRKKLIPQLRQLRLAKMSVFPRILKNTFRQERKWLMTIMDIS